MSRLSRPKVALGPEPAPGWVAAAVEAGGGVVVPPSDADALVWTDPHGVDELRATLDANPDLTWVQLPWAGVERFAETGLFADGRTWTCGKGVYAEPVAEHVMALALAGLRGLAARVVATEWGPPLGTSLYDGRVTILGGGGITEALLTLLAPMRTEVTVVRRRPEVAVAGARVVGRDRLHEALRGADAVVLALALTPETVGVIGRAELAAMEEHAWLVNVARGEHVVTADLVEALDNGWIGGAALDVTDPEPLPPGHPLFGRTNCIITPHCANTPEMARAPLTARITENVRRFATGQPLIGPVDPALGY